jgi:hypothetical protein
MQMNSRMIRTVLGALLSLLFILSSACSSEVTVSNSRTSGQAQSNVFMDMLRLIPATENTTQVAYVQDYSRLPNEQRQFPPPSPTPDGYPIMQNNRFWNLAHYDPQEWQKHMGFNQEDVKQEAFAYRIVPMDMYEVVKGSFDKAKIEAALKSDPINDDLTTVSYSGIEYFSAGEDGMNLQKRSNIRNLGQGLRLAVLGDTLLATTFTRSMQDLIDVRQKKTKSLADLDTYRQLAEGMARLDAMAAIFSSESQSQSSLKERLKDIIKDPGQDAGPSPRRNLAEQVQRNVILQPYQAFAVGFGVDEKGRYMAVALVHADEAAAKSNLSVLEKQVRASNVDEGRSWSEVITSMETLQDGRLVLSKLYGIASFHWKGFDMTTMGGDPLLMYKG